jgi:hypothetical protein
MWATRLPGEIPRMTWWATLHLGTFWRRLSCPFRESNHILSDIQSVAYLYRSTRNGSVTPTKVMMPKSAEFAAELRQRV